MKPYHLLIFLFFSLLLSACGEDFFEQTIEIDLPEHTPQLAITAELNAGDSVAWVYVTHSQGILDNAPANLIENAVVELFRDGQLMETLPFFRDGFYTKELASPFPVDPAEYRLKVSAEGYATIEATQQMPPLVPIISATYEPEGALDLDGERVDEITIEFEDPAGVDNYYEVSVTISTANWLNQVYLHRLDPLAEDIGNTLLLKDDSFAGKKHSWRVGFYPQYFDPNGETRIIVRLRSISRDRYFYERSVSLSYDADDNPFAEPVIIHSNVENGLGIFSLSANSEYVIIP